MHMFSYDANVISTLSTFLKWRQRRNESSLFKGKATLKSRFVAAKGESGRYSQQQKSILPPEGAWSVEGSIETATGAAPLVKLLDEPLKSLGEDGPCLRLAQQRTVPRSSARLRSSMLCCEAFRAPSAMARFEVVLCREGLEPIGIHAAFNQTSEGHLPASFVDGAPLQ